MTPRRIAQCSAGAVALIATTAARAQAPFRDFDRYVASAMQQWKVPGLALAVVRNDSVVFARGYGVRTLGTTDRVDERTLFAIGSASKAFTAAALGMLVDQGRLAWDDRAGDRLPGFRLYDAYASQELRLRDLLSHRSGLERGDLLWYGSSLSRDEIVRRVRFLEPSWSFRSRFGYQNLMYLAAGQVIARTSGMSWDDFIAQRIFRPLGMTSSNTSVRALAGQPNVATPHAEIDDTVRTVPWRDIDNIAPAGSINSHVLDMAQWVRLHLGDGQFAGQRLLSSAVVRAMQAPHSIVPTEGVYARLFPESNFTVYGLGWFLQDHRGRRIMHHGGNIDGMSALVAMIPSEHLGLVVLTNLNGTQLPIALMYRIFDAHLGAPAKDWSTDLRTALEPLLREGREQEQRAERERVTGTRPSHPLADYAGRYVDPDSLYGELQVSSDGDRLQVRYGPAFVGDAEHWHYETFRIRWREPILGRGFMTFSLGHDGKVAEVSLRDLADFRRRPESADTTNVVTLSEADLRRFVGRYSAEAPPIDLAIEMLDGRLRVVLPGQPAYGLAALTPTRFRVTGIPFEASVEFFVEGGRVVRAAITQQGRTFELRPAR